MTADKREQVARAILKGRGEESWTDDRMWLVAEGKQALSDADAAITALKPAVPAEVDPFNVGRHGPPERSQEV